MSPPRKKLNTHLPPRVYQKHGGYYFVDKNRKWIKLGNTLAEAMQVYSQMFERPLASKTMHAVFDRYMKEVSSQKAVSTHKVEMYNIQGLRTFFGPMKPDEITPVDVYEYLDLRKQQTVFQANKELSLLSGVLAYAIRWGVISQNVCRDIKRFKEPTRDRYVQDEEFETFYNYADDLIKAFMLVSYLTALRLGDVLDIKLGDLTEEGILIDANKTRKKSLIMWTDALRDAVNFARKLKRPVRGLYLFCTQKGKPYSSDGLKAIWQRKMRKAHEEGVLQERFMIKDLRAKAATDIEQNRGLEFAQALLGHSNASTTRRHYIRKVQKVNPVR